MKNYTIVIGLACICFCNFSCTVLQWRKSDQEIKETFKELDIASTISYFKVDSLDVNVRIQNVNAVDKNINLVFMHGSPSSLSAWEGYLKDESLRETSNMYAIDRPGYGYSNFGKALTSIDTQAQIISTIINEKKLSNVIVIGSSYGGPLAARVGFLNPRVKAVVMISPAIDPDNEKDIWASRFTRWKLTRWAVPTAYRVAGDEKKVHAQELELIANEWKQMTIPVLHFHGDADNIVPFENIHFSKKNFTNIEIIPISEKGHEIAFKDKELIIERLIRLIEAVEKKN